MLAKRVILFSEEYYQLHAEGWRPGAISEQICAFKVYDDTHEFGCWMTKGEEVNRKDFDTLVTTARDRQDKILSAKGDDYTIGNADEDRLYNFKQIAELTGLTPEQVWAVYFLKHVFAILAHTKGGAESEPITGRLDDAINYLYLLMGLLGEKCGEPQRPKLTEPEIQRLLNTPRLFREAPGL